MLDKLLTRVALLILIASPAVQGQADAPPFHDLAVEIHPLDGQLVAVDRITLSQPASRLDFSLSPGLEPTFPEADQWIQVAPGHYRLKFDSPISQIELRYSGQLRGDLATLSEGYAGGRQTSAGGIDAEGVFLSGASGWYPRLGDSLLTFRLLVRLPAGWTSVSQGESVEGGWQETAPQEEIYLVAAPFEVYQRDDGRHLAQVYLRQPDAELADRYLTATLGYLTRYSELLGPYPYAKFALVENHWQSGYGMPSFTLLGSQVIRLPFILHTSFPHEILHNWWGNGVFVDYSEGNWSEGLTSYLADHWLAEAQGTDRDYRRDTLRKYADHVRTGRDFPLREFIGNHGDVSQAVGYGKTLMLLHMLRRRLGDETFFAALRRFYREQGFHRASWSDLQRAFEQEANQPLADWFKPWLQRTGVPRLGLSEVAGFRDQDGFRITGKLQQTQAEAPFPLWVPIGLRAASDQPWQITQVAMNQREDTFSLESTSPVAELAVDPAFELMRQLETDEYPAALSALFGADRLGLVLPSQAETESLSAWRQLAAVWKAGAADQGVPFEILADDKIEQLPADASLWIVGAENRFAGRFFGGASQQLGRSGDQVQLADQSMNIDEISLVAVQRDGDRAMGLIIAPSQDLPTLARKLPHYGKYSWLAFAAGSVRNLARGQWETRAKGLSVRVPPDTH